MSHFAIRAIMLFLGGGFLLGNVWYITDTSLLLVFTGVVWVCIALIPKYLYANVIVSMLLVSSTVIHTIFIVNTYGKADSSMKITLLMIGLVYFLSIFISGIRNKTFLPI